MLQPERRLCLVEVMAWMSNNTVFMWINLLIHHMNSVPGKGFHLDLIWRVSSTLSLDYPDVSALWFFQNMTTQIYWKLNIKRFTGHWMSPGDPQRSDYCVHPKQQGRHFADDIFKRIFLNKKIEFWLKFQWSLFLGVQLTITAHWFKYWLGAEWATSHYLNQCWPDSLTHICGTRGR